MNALFRSEWSPCIHMSVCLSVWLSLSPSFNSKWPLQWCKFFFELFWSKSKWNVLICVLTVCVSSECPHANGSKGRTHQGRSNVIIVHLLQWKCVWNSATNTTHKALPTHLQVLSISMLMLLSCFTSLVLFSGKGMTGVGRTEWGTPVRETLANFRAGCHVAASEHYINPSLNKYLHYNFCSSVS